MNSRDAEVLAVCREAEQAGQRKTHAVMEHFNVDVDAAQALISSMRRRNPDHGLQRDPKGPSKGQTRKYSDTEVAALAWDAFRRGERMASVISRHFGITDRNATQVVARLRKEGVQIPYCAKAPHGPHLAARGCVCDECRPELQMPVVLPEPERRPKVTVIGASSIQLPEAALPMGPWVADAACRGINTNLFYPERGEPTRHALEVCKPCTVKADCLQYSIDNSERWGVWGGMTERQRRRIRSDRYQARRNAQ